MNKENQIESLDEFAAISDITSRMASLAMAKLFSKEEIRQFFDEVEAGLLSSYENKQQFSTIITQFKTAVIRMSEAFEEERNGAGK